MSLFPTSRAAALSFRPRLTDDLLLQRFGAESVAWNPMAGWPVYLDSVATLLIGIIDGDATVSELTDDVHEAIGIEPEVAESQILRVVGLYHDGGLLDIAEPSITDAGPFPIFDPPDY